MKHKQGKAYRQEIFDRYGKVCINCGDDYQIELHHVVPLCIGGNDIPSNIVPLCRRCHKAVTDHELILKAFGRKYSKYKGGRKQQKFDNSDNIFEDYVRCRITSKEAADRLGKPTRKWVEVYEFRDYKNANGIKAVKNKLGQYVHWNGSVALGEEVGEITYEDGTVEKIYWEGSDKAKSGKSLVPTKGFPADDGFDISKVSWTGKVRNVS